MHTKRFLHTLFIKFISAVYLLSLSLFFLAELILFLFIEFQQSLTKMIPLLKNLE